MVPLFLKRRGSKNNNNKQLITATEVKVISYLSWHFIQKLYNERFRIKE